MARVVLAWERGGGLGHAVPLARIAVALRRAGHEVHVVMRDLSVVDAAFGADSTDPGLRFWQAPLWQAPVRGLATPVSYAELLMRAGFLEAGRLLPLARAWLALLDAIEPALLLVDHAPTALLAAQARPQVRRVLFGNGFFIPPPTSPMPAFRDWEPLEPDRLETSEARVLQTCNAVLDALGAAPLPALHSLLRADAQCLLTWAAFDPYPDRPPTPGLRHWGPLPSGTFGTLPPWPAGDGAPVFAYLHAEMPGLDGVLARLAGGPWRTVACVPGLPPGAAARYASAQLAFATVPAPFARAAAEAAVVLCHANAGAVHASLGAGTPLAMLPIQVEQLLNARRVAAVGAGRWLVSAAPGDVVGGLLDGVLSDASARQAASAWRTVEPADDVAAAVATHCIALATAGRAGPAVDPAAWRPAGESSLPD